MVFKIFTHGKIECYVVACGQGHGDLGFYHQKLLVCGTTECKGSGLVRIGRRQTVGTLCTLSTQPLVLLMTLWRYFSFVLLCLL